MGCSRCWKSERPALICSQKVGGYPATRHQHESTSVMRDAPEKLETGQTSEICSVARSMGQGGPSCPTATFPRPCGGSSRFRGRQLRSHVSRRVLDKINARRYRAPGCSGLLPPRCAATPTNASNAWLLGEGRCRERRSAYFSPSVQESIFNSKTPLSLVRSESRMDGIQEPLRGELEKWGFAGSMMVWLAD